jgi:hypothetical protein
MLSTTHELGEVLARLVRLREIELDLGQTKINDTDPLGHALRELPNL